MKNLLFFLVCCCIVSAVMAKNKYEEWRNVVFSKMGLPDDATLAKLPNKQISADEAETVRLKLLALCADRLSEQFLSAFGDPLYPRRILPDYSVKIVIQADVSLNIFIPNSSKSGLDKTMEALRGAIQIKLFPYMIEVGNFDIGSSSTVGAGRTNGLLGEWHATLLR